MQTGNTAYQPKHCRHTAFISHEQVKSLIIECDVLVTQGGAGSIHEGLAAGRPVVAVPRCPELGESQDAQVELVRAMEQAGRLIAVYDIKDLYACIQNAFSFHPTPSTPHRINSLIKDFLERLP